MLAFLQETKPVSEMTGTLYRFRRGLGFRVVESCSKRVYGLRHEASLPRVCQGLGLRASSTFLAEVFVHIFYSPVESVL